MKSVYPTTLFALALPLTALSFLGLLALPAPSANAATPAAELCLQMSKTRIMTTAERSTCQEKISNSSFDPDAVGICRTMMEKRISTNAQIFSCIDAIRDKSYLNGTDVCLSMVSRLATTAEITDCLAKSGKVMTPACTTPSSNIASSNSQNRLLEIEAIDRALSRIDAALFQLDTDGKNASTQYAIEQLLKAKSELQRMKARFNAL